MDEDLANIIRRALDEAKATGRDDTGQTEHAVRKVRELRPDMTAMDALNAIKPGAVVPMSLARRPIISHTVPLTVGKQYDFQEFGWHLGNVGSIERKGFTP